MLLSAWLFCAMAAASSLQDEFGSSTRSELGNPEGRGQEQHTITAAAGAASPSVTTSPLPVTTSGDPDTDTVVTNPGAVGGGGPISPTTGISGLTTSEPLTTAVTTSSSSTVVTTLPSPQTSVTVEPSPTTTGSGSGGEILSPSSAQSKPSPGLSTEQTIGIGVGVGVGVLAIIVTIIAILLCRRKRNANARYIPAQSTEQLRDLPQQHNPRAMMTSNSTPWTASNRAGAAGLATRDLSRQPSSLRSPTIPSSNLRHPFNSGLPTAYAPSTHSNLSRTSVEHARAPPSRPFSGRPAAPSLHTDTMSPVVDPRRNNSDFDDGNQGDFEREPVSPVSPVSPIGSRPGSPAFGRH